ncbi:MAG: hypothetical protein CXT69_04025 [Methanobacteriota archaeon]|nr:MAG: hypothetical protein CXT69_04025 [Euryarchaeota archaeon]HIK78914.1 hypothetical protein [Candidatus Poseidoniales archaeon]
MVEIPPSVFAIIREGLRMGNWQRITQISIESDSGVLYRSCLPGSSRYDPDSLVLDEWTLRGIDVVFTLMPVEEMVARRGDDIINDISEHGFEQRHHPIKDFGAWEEGAFRTLVIELDEVLTNNQTVVVHCHAGVGRTGTLIAGLLIHRGHEIESAIDIINIHGMSVESHGQRELLERFFATRNFHDNP